MGRGDQTQGQSMTIIPPQEGGAMMVESVGRTSLISPNSRKRSYESHANPHQLQSPHHHEEDQSNDAHHSYPRTHIRRISRDDASSSSSTASQLVSVDGSCSSSTSHSRFNSPSQLESTQPISEGSQASFTSPTDVTSVPSTVEPILLNPRRALRRSGTGGFYERDMSPNEEKSLVELLHSASNQASNTQTATAHAQELVIEEPIGSPLLSDLDDDSPVATPRASTQEEIIERQMNSRGGGRKYKNVAPHQLNELTPEEEIERTGLLSMLACSLEQICPLNVELPEDPNYLSLFHTSSLPNISIRDYLSRLAVYTGVSDECLIQAMIHIRRLSKNGLDEIARANRTPSDDGSAIDSDDDSDSSSTSSSESIPFHPRMNTQSPHPFTVSAFNIHRLLLTAILTSAKFVDDQFYNNAIYSSLGGVSLTELNRLESEFLQLVDYQMHISAEVFFSHYHAMNHSTTHGENCTDPTHKVAPVYQLFDYASIVVRGDSHLNGYGRNHVAATATEFADWKLSPIESPPDEFVSYTPSYPQVAASSSFPHSSYCPPSISQSFQSSAASTPPSSQLFSESQTQAHSQGSETSDHWQPHPYHQQPQTHISAPIAPAHAFPPTNFMYPSNHAATLQPYHTTSAPYQPHRSFPSQATVFPNAYPPSYHQFPSYPPMIMQPQPPPHAFLPQQPIEYKLTL